jgi:phosphomannomutase
MDENGDMVSPPLLATLVGQRLREKLGPDARVAANLASSWVVADTLGDRNDVLNGPVIMTPVGYGKIKVIMNENRDVAFGAEHSGHYVFREFWGADSGMLAAILMLELAAELHALGRKFSSVLEEPRSRYFESGEINFQLPAGMDGDAVIADAVRALSDEIRRIYVIVDDKVQLVDAYPPEGVELSVADVRAEADNWWFCMRKSGTEGSGGGILRLYLEADSDKALMESRRDKLVDMIGPEMRI